MRRVLLALLLVLSACGPQFPPPDHAPRSAPVPEDTRHHAAAADEEPAAAEPAPTAASIHVDHAWVKGSENAAEQAKRKATIEALRAKVLAGAGFVVAWESLGADGNVWHVAEGETYEADVIPEQARTLPVGQVSAVIPGDGGFHLFRILGRD